jgi:hypothetical protein
MCGKKLCCQYLNPLTGRSGATARDQHDVACCRAAADFTEESYCPGGHNSHCERRWTDAALTSPHGEAPVIIPCFEVDVGDVGATGLLGIDRGQD